MFYRQGEGKKRRIWLFLALRGFFSSFFVLAADFYNLRRWSSSVQPTGISKTSHCLAKCASEGRPDKTSADGLAAASNANFMFRVHFADFARQNNITAEKGSRVHSDQKWGLVRWSGGEKYCGSRALEESFAKEGLSRATFRWHSQRM